MSVKTEVCFDDMHAALNARYRLIPTLCDIKADCSGGKSVHGLCICSVLLAYRQLLNNHIEILFPNALAIKLC